MQDNYRAWDITADAFPKSEILEEQLKFLLGFAILAPSSHNSQPWSFEISGNSIKVYAVTERRLISSDKNDRQLYISLGCVIANIVVAADYYGMEPVVRYLPDYNQPDFAAEISFSGNSGKSPDSNHLIFAIPKRTNNRNKYDNCLPDETFLNKLRSLAAQDLRIDLIRDPQKKNQLADIAIAAGIAAMEDEKFREELSRYVKSNLTKSKIGMPAFGMGIPTPVSLAVPFMIRRFNMNKLNRKKDEALLKKFTSCFIVVSAKNDDRGTWLKAGELYERISLLAVQAGMSTAVWAAPIQIGEFYKEFQKVLETNFRPQLFFRLGRAKRASPHSPRLAVNDVLR